MILYFKKIHMVSLYLSHTKKKPAVSQQKETNIYDNITKMMNVNLFPKYNFLKSIIGQTEHHIAISRNLIPTGSLAKTQFYVRNINRDFFKSKIEIQTKLRMLGDFFCF